MGTQKPDQRTTPCAGCPEELRCRVWGDALANLMPAVHALLDELAANPPEPINYYHRVMGETVRTELRGWRFSQSARSLIDQLIPGWRPNPETAADAGLADLDDRLNEIPRSLAAVLLRHNLVEAYQKAGEGTGVTESGECCAVGFLNAEGPLPAEPAVE